MINNILILGYGNTANMLCYYLKEAGISHLAVGSNYTLSNNLLKIIEARRGLLLKYPIASHGLPASVFFSDELITWIDSKLFTPEWIINTSDCKDYVELERKLGILYQTKNQISEECAHFFTYKSAQDQVCKQLNIPTLPQTGNQGLCVKRDSYSFHREMPNYNPVKVKWAPSDYTIQLNEFAQAWSKLETIFNLSFIVDDKGKIALYDSSKLLVERSMILQEIFPCLLTADEADQIKHHIVTLVNYLGFNSRIVFYQLAKVRGDTTLYNLDWNARIGGDTCMKRPGRDVGSFDLVAGLWDVSVFPTTISFNTQYRGNTVWSYYPNQFSTGEPLKLRAWEDDLSGAIDYRIGSIDTISHSLVRLN